MCCIQMWEEELAARKAVRHEAEVRTAFEQLDTDSDGYITVAEVQHRLELDDDEDGEVRVKVVMGRGERVRVVRRGGMRGDMWYLLTFRSLSRRLWPIWTMKNWSIFLSS